MIYRLMVGAMLALFLAVGGLALTAAPAHAKCGKCACDKKKACEKCKQAGKKSCDCHDKNKGKKSK